MSSNKEVGIIRCTTVGIEWEIPNFFPYSLQDWSYHSPPFQGLNEVWFMSLHLNMRDMINGDHGFLSWGSLYLEVRNPTPSYLVNFKLGIRGLKKPCEFGPKTRIFDSTNVRHGKENLFKTQDIVHARVNQNDNSIVLYCDVAKGLWETKYQKTFLSSYTAINPDFQDFLLSGKRSDLTIVVRGHEFKAHKLILEAHSAIFTTMFEHDMTEKKENIIKIEDCNPDTFQIFLQCMYAGRVENSSVDKAIRLYMIAHKYAVIDITGICVQRMKDEMSEETVCDILALATKYNESGLKNLAKKYMAENINKILSTSNWDSFVAAAANSVLQKFS